MSDNNNDTVIDISGYDATHPYDDITYSSGIDTITLSPKNYGVGSITLPSTFTTTRIGSTTNTTVPNGGYTITTGAGTGHNWNTGSTQINADGVQIKEGGDIKIGGKSLGEAIDKIEERLGILNPNPELEERWDKLKELRKQYIEMERDLLEKEKIMKILKEA
jgi:hypothetical protein